MEEGFEKEGLKIDKERVLTYSQLSCPFDCEYCFVDDLSFNREKGVPYLSKKQFELLGRLPEDIKLIMLGCDTEFFQAKNDALETLRRLIPLGKDVSVVTKQELTENFIQKLVEIDALLRTGGNFLTFSTSITCMESASKWEPRAPSPKARIETLKLAFNSGLKTLVAMRPLLPTISDEELGKVVYLCKDFCYGFYSGPLYLKDLSKIKELGFDPNNLTIEKIQPHWMPRGNVFFKVERNGQLDYLRSVLANDKKPLFEGAAEGITFLKTNEKH